MYDVPELAIAALEYLSGEIERVEWNRTQEIYNAPTQNVGGEYTTDKFEMRSFCWCDGTKHHWEVGDSCPPNFKWRDIEIEWYKYLGRGTVSNKELTSVIIEEMLDECLRSVRARDI